MQPAGLQAGALAGRLGTPPADPPTRAGDEDSETLLPVMTTEEHLAELRRRLLICLGTAAFTSVAGWFLSPALLRLFAHLVGRPLVFVTPAEALVSRIRLALGAGLLLASPVLVAQAWWFVLPALFPSERRLASRLVPLAFVLFLAGLAFGYFAVLPVALRFFLSFQASWVEPAISVGRFLSFFLSITLPFGLVFQLPIVTMLAIRVGMLSTASLRRQRRLIYFGAFVVAAVLTPADPVSMFLLAVPGIALFELGVWWGQR